MKDIADSAENDGCGVCDYVPDPPSSSPSTRF